MRAVTSAQVRSFAYYQYLYGSAAPVAGDFFKIIILERGTTRCDALLNGGARTGFNFAFGRGEASERNGSR